MHLLTLNAAGKRLAAPIPLDPRRRRLSQVIGRHVDRSRPHMIAVQRARDPLQPIDEAWILRGKDRAGTVRSWPRRYLPADAIVVVVYLPLGGGGGAAGGRSKGVLSIAMAVAAVALIAFAGPIGTAAAAALELAGTAATIAATAIQVGVVVGATALLSLASRAKANKEATDTTKVYGVAGGGNLPRQGERIPRGYGRSWMKPDLSQQDFSQYDGDDQILFKRHTLGLGRYRPYQIRAGKQVIWQEAAGFVAPFDDARNRVEFIYGTASTLIPSNVVSASGIGGLLPRPADFPQIAGPFLVNQRGALVTRLQVDFQFPQGISLTQTKKSGTVVSNLPGIWSVLFEYAPIDESGAVTGAWQTLYDGSWDTEGARFATHPLRYTKFRDVPAGRYAVRGRNRLADTSAHTGTGGANIDAVQWDSGSGWVGDVAVRPGITEMCLRIYATKASQVAAFGEVEVDAGAIIPVWTGSAWVEQETSKAVWAFIDAFRNTDYGGALPDDQLPLTRALQYASTLTEFDTFDGTIRGPASVYEVGASILLAMRAEPVHLGSGWSFVRDEPKSVRRHVITRRQMLKGSTQLVFDLDTESGANHVVGEFDQDGDYRSPNQVTAIYGQASLTPVRQRWTGVKSYAHAQHLTRWKAAAGAFRRQSTPFGVELEGRIYQRGDSISVDPWFIIGGKVGGVVAAAGDVLTLDADVAVAVGDQASLRDRDGREWGPLALTGQGATLRQVQLATGARQALETATGRTLAAVLRDDRGDLPVVRVGPVSVLQENYLIQSVKMSGESQAQVTAVIDDPRVWAAIGAAASVPAITGAGLADPVSPRVLAITANAVPIAAGLRLDYAIRPARGAVRFETGISYDNGARWEVQSEAPVTGTIGLNAVDQQSVLVRARAFGSTGLPGTFVQTVVVLSAPTVNVSLPPIDYAGLAPTVQAQIDRLDGIQQQAAAAALAAQNALTTANGRLDALRRSLAADPAIRRGYVDGIVGDIRHEVAVLADATTRNFSQLAMLQDTMAAAGIEVVAAEGIVRIAAISKLESTVGTQITNLSLTLDALKGQIDLYGSVQAGDLQGVISSITTVQQRLDALAGTVTTLATAAQFTDLSTRLSSAQQTIDGQAAAIASKASLTTVTAQGTRISQAETRLDAAEGRIFNVVTAAGSSAADARMLPRLLSQLGDLLGSQIGAIQQNIARAETNLSANFDDAGRAVAEVSTRLLVFRGEASAQFATVTRAIADTSSALVQATTSYDAQFAGVTASLVQEMQVRAAADGATTSSLSGALSRIGVAEAGLTSLGQTVATNASSTATQFQGVSARFATNEANLSGVITAYTTADQALGQRIDTVTARIGNAEGLIAGETQARVSAEGVLTSQYNGLVSRVGGVEAGVSSVSQAQASTNQALANVNFDLVTRSNAGTAVGRFGMNVASAPAGVSVRIAAVASTESYGQQRNAGWYLDLLPDGTSRFVIDANFFALTANGGITYPFTFDGTTLTIPSLRVTQSLIAPDAVNAKYSPIVQDIDPGAGSDTWREIPGTAVVFTPDTQWSAIFSGYGTVSTGVNGSNNFQNNVSLQVVLGLDGVPFRNAGVAAVVSSFASAGGGLPNNVVDTKTSESSAKLVFFDAGIQRRVSLLYKFNGNALYSGKINFAQLNLVLSKR